MNKTILLLKYNLIEIEKGSKATAENRIFPPLATVISNLYYYGLGISIEIYEDLLSMNKEELTVFWHGLEPSLKEISLDNREISENVVYQNFPDEVLQMDAAEYWIKQILMYFGFDKDNFREEKKERPALLYDTIKLVLQKANERSLFSISNSLLSKPAKWTADEELQVKWLIENDYIIHLEEIPFKENLIFAGLVAIQNGKEFVLKTATDVLRFIIGLSAGDISLKQNSKIRSFKRSERRFLLELLSKVNDLEEGLMRHLNKWIKVLHSLHIGDYKKEYPRLFEAAQIIRNDGKLPTFNSKVEKMLLEKDPAVLTLLQSRPGDFTRRLIHCISLFGQFALSAYLPMIVMQPAYNLLKLKRLLETYPSKKFKTIAPKGNWSRLQIQVQGDFVIDPTLFEELVSTIKDEIKSRHKITEIDLDSRSKLVKLPSNNADAVLPYGRGTVFIIPENIKFVRTATYWEAPSSNNIWYDNGWNFFDENWKPAGTVCWNSTEGMKPGSVFSGDPVNSMNAAGKATQLIDLYLEELPKMKVRYAVWNILCYNHIPFSKVKEVLGLLEMGEKADEGKLIEPSRATFAFPIKGDSLTKFVCYIDIEKRELVYLDANLKGQVRSATLNAQGLSEQMPAILEYLDTLPSVYDIFESIPQNESAEFKVYYDDLGKKVEKGFVFRRLNEENSFENSSIPDLLKI